MNNITGTIHHLLCPICGNRTIDPLDGECRYIECGQEDSDSTISERLGMDGKSDDDIIEDMFYGQD